MIAKKQTSETAENKDGKSKHVYVLHISLPCEFHGIVFINIFKLRTTLGSFKQNIT